MNSQPDHYLVCVLGPTAVGKTALAIELAKHFQTEILSADSRQFFKEISIGTAKPTATELASIPHHLIGHISIHQRYSAGDFEREALAQLMQLFTKHRLVIMVGGSGLYIKALLEGLDQMPEGNELLRKELDDLFAREGITGLQQRLLQHNPDAASTMDIRNTQRVMRAIEIAESGIQPTSSTKVPRPFKVIKLVIHTDREKLYQRINQRVDEMMKQGLEEEARKMLPFRDAYALQTVGYTELFDYFDGKHSLERAVELIKQHTRNYAKRQLTWFRKEQNTHWFEPQQVNEIIDCIKSLTKQ